MASIIAKVYTYFFLTLAIISAIILDFKSDKIFWYVVLPFILISLFYQTRDPLTKDPIENNELKTDIISFTVVIIFTSIQNYLVHLYFYKFAVENLEITGIPQLSAIVNSMPFWLQCMTAYLFYDFMFYVTHRVAHTNPFLWKFHTVHHSANKVTYMNSNRIHPVDLIFRRFTPVVVLLMFGFSLKAFVCVQVIVNILGPITHLNINLKHGIFNYIIGTNEVHVWHHSTKEHEALNYGISMIWDHLFGTFYFPSDRRVPVEMGLHDPEGYPIHDYWKQLIYPWRTK